MVWINTSWLFRGKLVTALAIVGLIALIPVIGVARSTSNTQARPTVVLVHGTFADAAGWNGVIERLQDRGYSVTAVANPLRGFASDSAYLRSILETIMGPIVLVGHSYGGAVLTNAATGLSNVNKLVYIAAFAPDAGETLAGLLSMNPGSMLVPDNLVFRPYPGGIDGYIKPNKFHAIFAADVDRETAAVLAAGQRPSEVRVLDEQSGTPAWKTIPSWYLVATNDRIIPAKTQRFMAERARATTIEVRTSHAAMISRPERVARLILQAAREND